MPCFHLKSYEIKWISGFIYNHTTNSAIHYLSIKMHRFIYKKNQMSINKKKKQPIFWFLEQRLIYCISYTVFCIHSVFRSFFVCFLFFFCYRKIQVGVCVGGGLLLLMIGRRITRFYLLFECVDFLTITRNICWKPTTEYLLVWTKKSNSYFKYVVPFFGFFRRGDVYKIALSQLYQIHEAR